MTMMENSFAQASGTGFTSAASKVARAIYEQAERAWRRHRDRRHIYEMPDYLLKDIGISRSEIDSVLMYGEADMTRRHRGAEH